MRRLGLIAALGLGGIAMTTISAAGDRPTGHAVATCSDAVAANGLIATTHPLATAIDLDTSKAGAAPTGQSQACGVITVDVVLGFTNGLVTRYGSVAQAQARLRSLVALTNEAYANSRIDHRIRLVGTVQVNYTDTSTNANALRALTGVSCPPSGCVPATVPVELQPLRTAREAFGADLVGLVRPLLAPQQQGCGDAWLLGEGGFAIDNTDAPFGYAVVSDGSDINEEDGRTVTCDDGQLAHELGHNMGQAHNVEDAPSPGTNAFSYGYRESAGNGFYTLMALPLPGGTQRAINAFSNPMVNDPVSGRPIGTASADNARSMNVSMPLVAQFRSALIPEDGVHCDGFE